MTKIVDISLPLDAGFQMHTPEGVKNVQLAFELIKDYPGGAGQMVSAVHMRLHNGTHVDAPMHFVQGGHSIDQMPLETFYGPGVMADLTAVPEGAPITADDLAKAFQGTELHGARVFLRTDFNHHYGEESYDEKSPYISVGAVDWLVEQGPVLVSYDYSHGKDDPEAPSRYYAVRTFLEHGIVTMGYVRNLDKIDPGRPFRVAALPLAFKAVESSPVRAILIQD